MKAMARVLAGLVIGFAVPSWARSETLSICLERWEPYYTIDEAGTPKGAAIDVLKAVFAEIGHVVHYQELPYGRCLQSVRHGDVDGVLTVSPGEADLEYVNVPLAFWKIAAVVRSDDPLTSFESFDQFDGYTPIFYTGYTYPEIFADILSRPSAIGLPSQEDTLQPLRIIQSRTRHVSFEDLDWVRKVARRDGLSVRALEPAIMTEPNFLAFAPKRATVSRNVQIVLQRMERDGTLEAVYSRYFDVTESALPFGS